MQLLGTDEVDQDTGNPGTSVQPSDQTCWRSEALQSPSCRLAEDATTPQQKVPLPLLLFTAAAQEALVKVEVEVHNAIGADAIRTECACLRMQFFRQASQVQGNKTANLVTEPPCCRTR